MRPRRSRPDQSCGRPGSRGSYVRTTVGRRHADRESAAADRVLCCRQQAPRRRGASAPSTRSSASTRATLKPLPYDGPDGIRAMLEGMTRVRLGAGRSRATTRSRCSATAPASRLEPGGQFELSGAPLETLHETCCENAQHLDEVKQVAGEIGVGIHRPGLPAEVAARGHALDAQGPLQDHARATCPRRASSAST